MCQPGGLAAGQHGSRKAQGESADSSGATPLLNYTQRTSRVKNPSGYSKVLQISVEAITYCSFYRYAFQCFQYRAPFRATDLPKSNVYLFELQSQKQTIQISNAKALREWSYGTFYCNFWGFMITHFFFFGGESGGGKKQMREIKKYRLPVAK